MNKFLENKWALSITAGVLLGLSFPPVDLSFLSFPAFILLFLLADKCDSNKQLAYYSYAGFVVWNLITTYWLMMASLIAGIAAVLANAAIMTIPLILIRVCSKRFDKSWLIALLHASIWVSYEFLHHNWDLSWPWLTIGNAWANQVSLIQYISATGHLGISFWVIFTSSLAFLAIKNPHHLAYNFEYGRPVFIYRDSPYLNKHSEAPKNSGNMVVIREIILLQCFQSQVFIPTILVLMEIVDGGRWRIKNLQEKRSLFVSVFVFLEKNSSKTKNLTVLA